MQILWCRRCSRVVDLKLPNVLFNMAVTEACIPEIYSVCNWRFITGSHKEMIYREEICKAWFTLATEAEAESEAQGALRSSVNQKSESKAESEGSEEFLFLSIPLPLPSLPIQ